MFSILLKHMKYSILYVNMSREVGKDWCLIKECDDIWRQSLDGVCLVLMLIGSKRYYSCKW